MGKVWKFIVEYVRWLYPFGICMIGALFLLVADANRLVGAFIAVFSFWWAIDLARTQADIAGKLVTTLTSGHDTNINVIYRPAALSEEQG